MDIILTQDIAKVGYKGDIVKVRPGYARNYLIPQGLAVIADKTNRKIAVENQRQAAHKVTKLKADAEHLGTQLMDLNLEMRAKTGANGKIFGSITTLQIAQALKDRGFDIDRRKISLATDIKETGQYNATIDLHREVKAKVNINVLPEDVA